MTRASDQLPIERITVSARLGKKVMPPTISTTASSSIVKVLDPVSRSAVPLARLGCSMNDPARATTATMTKNRPTSIATARLVSHHVPFTVRPPMADPFPLAADADA
jgi:hypothetical protein